MGAIIRIFILTQVWLKGVVSGTAVSSGQTYPICFMNITGGGLFIDIGFIQIYGYSVNATQIKIAALTSNVNEFGVVGEQMETTFNYTEDYDRVTFVTPLDSSGTEATGIIPSSNQKATFIGVKSDSGSTDAFLALPLVMTSLEFFVASWPNEPPFGTSCAIIPALNHTCIEMYKFFPDGSALLLASTSLNQYDTYRYFGNYTLNSSNSQDLSSYEDLTGYYINTTKPVQVLCGHECADVPIGKPFCDHMVEQIPSVDQLGTSHIVPPIGGRSPQAGYVVRVVATQDYTSVTWQSVSLPQGVKVIRLGQFAEIVTFKTMEPLQVVCNQTCLVMQYKKEKSTDCDSALIPLLCVHG